MEFIVHGSEDSCDYDIHYISSMPLMKEEAKRIADNSPDGNANVIFVDKGKVAWTYKGSVDEINNGILATYHLHDQYMPCPVTEKADREVAVKVVRTVRGLLGVHSRGPMRLEVKSALRSPSMTEKLNTLSRIKISNDFGDRDPVNSLKFVAFQLIQCYVLVSEGREVFTKSACARAMNQLRPFLYRKAGDLNALQSVWDSFIYLISNSYMQTGDYITVMNRINGKSTTAHILTELPLK